ncbi:MAG: tRNA (N6-isopentenyl adenosine(37)-C2)-methylthiotransferase MiaB [Deltaproteobacteria bacterium]|nr:tRNA (N6-isopentenyl adenosine(37)-C2)-methylthiotransferase MiaB [Deltaproteobacteria bacterium]
MNILDSELIQNQLLSKGHELVEDPKKANVVLYNTCSVRDLSEQKVLSRLGIDKQRKDNGEELIVGVLGCMAERTNTDILAKNPHIDILVGPSRLNEISGLLEKLSDKSIKRQIALSNFRFRKGKKLEHEPMDSLEALDAARLTHGKQRKSQAYIRITRGCNKFCSFCVVPKTRGPEVHRTIESIVKESKALVQSGVIEITLLGQTINHYPDFARLLREVHDQNLELKRLRFMTSHPRDFTDEMLDAMAMSERICKYLHIPAQSGSNTVLRRMNRGYTREIYMDLIHRAKAKMPGISLLGDMIVGFPGETEEDFEASLSLLKEVRYQNVFIFKYSPRPGTVADKNLPDDIPWDLKKKRNNKMLEFQKQISLAEHQKALGQILNILVEGPAKNGDVMQGRTEGDQIVLFKGGERLIGKLVKVKIQDATALSLMGEVI